MSRLAELLLDATKHGTNEYAAFKALSAVEIGAILTEARHERDGANQWLQSNGPGCVSTCFTLQEYLEPGESHVPAVVEINKSNIFIGFAGYGDCGTATGHGRPIGVELCDGALRVYIWSDINNEDPTHVIDLDGAREELRQDEP